LGFDRRSPAPLGGGANPLPESPFLPDWLFFHADRTPEAPAVGSPTARLSYGELARRVRALAGHFAATGIGPGSRVVLALPNTPATVVAGLALNALGATSVEVSREWSAAVLGEITTRSRVRHAIVWGRDARTWAAALWKRPVDHVFVVHPSTVPVAFPDAFGGSPATLILDDGRIDPDIGPAPRPPAHNLELDQTAMVLYTSGSTGRPHGVIQTFQNVDANTRSIVEYLGLTAQDRALVTLPLYYCYGRSVLQTHLFAGGSVFLDNRMAFPRTVLETLASEECTGFAGVPLTYEIIRRQVDVSTITFPRLRYLTQAGGAMTPDTISWVRTAFQPAKLFVMYGQTEATARLSYLPPDRAEDKAGSIGIPIPGVELRVVDEHGRELLPGEVGELVARGPNVTPGYLDEPKETEAILRDGWLWTGDLAERDDEGFLYHRGRVKDILKIGGHRVSPVEIEQVIARHPGVAEAAVVGVKDTLMGEVPRAVVVPRPGATPSAAELLQFCRERLPAYQVPVTFVLVEALPRNESGKLLRAELAARYGRER
jgi:acyl-CoA synthetase (AMP-forming)/AMP-acid ligase II